MTTLSLEAVLAGLALIVTGVACTPTSPVSPVSLTLKVGEAAQLAGGVLTLTFDEVTGDSRCPKDVDCVWAGEATVVFKVR
jgi:hypothetical protein